MVADNRKYLEQQMEEKKKREAEEKAQGEVWAAKIKTDAEYAAKQERDMKEKDRSVKQQQAAALNEQIKCVFFLGALSFILCFYSSCSFLRGVATDWTKSAKWNLIFQCRP